MTNLAFDMTDGEDVIKRPPEARAIPRITIQAFCDTPEVAGTIETAAMDRRMSRAHVKVHTGGLNAAAEFYRSAPTPNLIMVESRLPHDEIVAALESLAEVCDAGTKVMVIGHSNDVRLYRELLKRGVSEYLVAPVDVMSVIASISGIYHDSGTEKLGQVYAFIGAKGGVGSSTIAHNVGWCMSTLFRSEVVVMDLDLPFGTANINFDQDPVQGIAEAVFSPERIDEVYLDRLLAQCAEHLSLLAAPSTLDRVYDFDADAFTSIIDTAQRTAPLLVLDVPHIWSGWSRSTLAQADEVVITAVPDLANLRNTKNMVDMLKKLRPNDAPPRLVLNQAGIAKRPEISPADFSEPLGLSPMAVVPFDPQLFGNASNNGRMLGEMDSKHPAVQMIRDIAHVLTGRGEIKTKKQPILADLLGKLKRKK